MAAQSQDLPIVDLLRRAWSIVEAAALPEHVHGRALSIALARLDAEPGTQAHPSGGAGGSGSTHDHETEDASGEPSTDEDEFFKRFARESHALESELREVYYFDNGKLMLATSRAALGDSITKKNITVATLLAGAEFYAHGTRAIGIGAIRTLAESLGLDPTRNLGKHIESVPGTIHVGKGDLKGIRVQDSKFGEPFLATLEAVRGG